MIFRSANRWNSFSFGKLISRPNEKFLGTARLSQEITGTGTVVFPLDRDIRGTGSTSQVQIGQSVWVVNQGYSGSGPDTPARFEIGKVVDVNSNSITLSEMTSSGIWRSGSLIGLESQNVYSFTQVNAATPTCNILFNQDFFNNNSSANLFSDTNASNFGGAEGPSLDNFYKGSRIYVRAASSFDGSYRGYLQHLIQVSTGSLANGSRITRDIYGPPFVEENSWLIFPSATMAGISQKCFALGPYARDFSGL
ncbi:MAG: hypothetical protein HC875_15255 [Anaerolineales bacterium]|nr:hypothetical protein [Anaerolineales bacterium]